MADSTQWFKQHVFRRYGAAILSVAAALLISSWLQILYGFEPFVPFLCAMMFSAWFGGIKPGLLTAALSLLAFHYYFLVPVYPLGTEKEIPRLLFAALTSFLIVLVSATQRRATEALRESEQRFRQIAENITEVFWLTTVDLSKTLYVSPAYETIWGRSRESLYQDPRSFLVAIHPADRLRVVEIMERERTHGFEIEYRVVRPDGSMRWIRDRGFPIRDGVAHAYRMAGIAEDITDRKLAVEKVKQADDRIRLTIDTIPAMVWSLRPDGSVDFLNHRWMDYAGLSLEEYVKDPVGPIHPEDVPSVMEKWRANMVTGEPYEHEMRLRRADGEYRWFLVRTAPLRGKDGSIVQWFGSSFDIEDRKKAEEAQRRSERKLREQEKFYRLLTENTNDFIRMHELDGRSIYGSPSVERLYGRQPTNIFEYAHPEDLESCRQWWSRILAASTERLTWRVRDQEGRWRWMETRASVVQFQGRQHVMTYCRDVTERKEAAEMLQQAKNNLRTVLDAAPALIHTARPDGYLDYFNQRWLNYVGLPLEELEGWAWLSVIHPEDKAGEEKQWRACVASGEPFEREVRTQRADGKYRWMLHRKVPVRDEAGNIVKWYGSGIDIDDRKEAEEALRGSEQQLHSLVRRMNTVREEEAKRIARELHDDLGQKLTALNMGLADLETKLGDATRGQRAQLAQMHTNVDQMIEVVHELSSELRLGQLDVLGLTAAIEWQLKEFSRRSKITCKVTRLDEVTHLSDAQSTAVFRILQETLTNIVRHAGATHVEVSLQATPNQLSLRIHDNGRGVTTAELNDRKAIGLLGMRERAQNIGGTVTIKGETGQGTTVLVSVPLKPDGKIPA